MQDYERYITKVDTTADLPSGCWPWVAQRNTKGYGVFWFSGRKRPATHAAWFFATGTLPPADKRVLHHCDNPPCVRPTHLWLGSPLDNMRDMIAKGRARHPVRLGLRTWSKLTDDDVRTIRASYLAGGVTQQALADTFGVSRRLIGGIVRGKRWRTV